MKITQLLRCGETYEKHRIPGMIITAAGTLIVYHEARRTAEDWAMMDILYQRSTDNGDTFEPPTPLASGTEQHPTVNNPVMVQDKNCRIHFIYCEDYAVGGGRVLHRFSDDDGVSWSSPADITRFTAPNTRNCFAPGPGHGICLEDGRLLIPVWMVPRQYGAPLRQHSPSVVTALLSDDCGETWRLGRLIWSTPDAPNPNETSAAQLADGRIYMNIRNMTGHRARAYSSDGGESWSGYEADHALPDPRCFGSAVALPASSGDAALLFANCASCAKRNTVTLRQSRDGGQRWDRSLVIDRERGGYVELAADEHTVYVLYEENGGDACHLARLALSEILT